MNLMNILFWCEGQRLLVGRLDPVDLYYNLELWICYVCSVYVGGFEAVFSDTVEPPMRHHTFVTDSLTCKRTPSGG